MGMLRFAVAGVLAVVVLSGCAREPVAEPPSVPTQTATPTPSATPLDLTMTPENRYGIDCKDLMGASDFSGLFDHELPLAPSREYGSLAWEALTQDKALQCRWGDQPSIDDRVPALVVVALPGTPTDLAALAAGVTPVPNLVYPTAMTGVGDQAWATCYLLDYATPETARCSWAVSVGDTWLWFRFDRIAMTEVNKIFVSGNRTDAEPVQGSLSAKLVARIAEQVRATTAAPVAPVTPAWSGCESVIEWSSLETQLALPYQGEVPRDAGSLDLGGSMIAGISAAAAEHQSVRRCTVTFGDWTDNVRPTWMSVLVVPNGTWLASTDLWNGWGSEYCHSYEGGPVCEYAALSGTTAVYVMVSGDTYEGVAPSVVAALLG